MINDLQSVVEDGISQGEQVLGDSSSLVDSFTGLDYGISAATLVLLFLLLRLKTNLALAVFGLCVGYFFQALATDELIRLLGSRGYGDSFGLHEAVNAFLVFTPAVLILVRFKGYQQGRLMIHLIPAAAFMALATLLTIEILPFSTQQDLNQSSYIAQQLSQNEFIIALVAVLAGLIDIVLLESQRERGHKRIKKEQSRLFRR